MQEELMEGRDEEEDTDQVNRPAYNAHWGPKQNVSSGYRWHRGHGTPDKYEAMNQTARDLAKLTKENLSRNPKAAHSFSKAAQEATELRKKFKGPEDVR